MSRRGPDLVDRWPHIHGALRLDAAGMVDDDYMSWEWHVRKRLSAAKRAAAYEEWACYFEYRLEQRAGELADHPGLRRLVEGWTDSVAYCCRRLAVYARGENPGPVMPQRERRPDLGWPVSPDTAGDAAPASECTGGGSAIGEHVAEIPLQVARREPRADARTAAAGARP